MPVRPETLRLQTPHRALRQITVLKTAAGKHHALLAGTFGNRNDAFRQGDVELGGDDAHACAFLNVRENGFNHRRPVQNT